LADQLVGVMAKVWAQYWGPRTDDILRAALLPLLEMHLEAKALDQDAPQHALHFGGGASG